MAGILLVVGDAASATAADTALQTILEDGGANTVTLISDEAAVPDLSAYSVVVHSTTVDPTALGQKYRNPAGVGVVCIPATVADTQTWMGNANTGTSSGVEVENDGHDLNNGLTVAGNPHALYAGNITMQSTTSTSIGDGTIIFRRTGGGSRIVCIGWDDGDQLAGGGQPPFVRHVFAGFAAVPGSLNALGQATLLNAVEWAGKFGKFAEGATGAAALTLPAATLSATGTVAVAGTLDATLPALTLTATGTVTVQGAAALTLPALTETAAGAVQVQGTAASSLPFPTLSATGAVQIVGSAALSLPALTITATTVAPTFAIDPRNIIRPRYSRVLEPTVSDRVLRPVVRNRVMEA